ncbi:MAG: hypothetical protein WAK82_41200 [Streptosporangiaceae bacterium]
MTTPGPDQGGGASDTGDGGRGDGEGGRAASLQALARDIERLHELTRPHVAEGDDDLSQAVARIPGAQRRREAGELLTRIKRLRGSRMNGLAR